MPLEPERRDFVRVAADIPVGYRFRPHAGKGGTEALFAGTTANLSGGGLLLQGKLPSIAAVTDLLTGRTTLDIELALPGDAWVIRAKGRCAWVETVEEATLKCHLGVRFTEISPEDKERIFRFVIRVQLPV